MKLHRFALPAALLITGAFIAGACTVGTVDSDDFGGSGGQGGSDGAGTGGSATGGAGGQGGDAGESVDCQPDGEAQGTLASTAPAGSDDECVSCQKEKCGDLYAVCNATDPQGACTFGTTEYGGETIDGEFNCMNSCLFSDDVGVADEEAIDFCASVCGSAECNPDSVSQVTLDLVTCLAIPTSDDPDVCLAECYPGL